MFVICRKCLLFRFFIWKLGAGGGFKFNGFKGMFFLLISDFEVMDLYILGKFYEYVLSV